MLKRKIDDISDEVSSEPYCHLRDLRVGFSSRRGVRSEKVENMQNILPLEINFQQFLLIAQITIQVRIFN